MPIEEPRQRGQQFQGSLPPQLMALLAAMIQGRLPELLEFAPELFGQGDGRQLPSSPRVQGSQTQRPQRPQQPEQPPQQPQVPQQPQRPEDLPNVRDILLKGIEPKTGRTPGGASPGPGASQKKPREGTPGSRRRQPTPSDTRNELPRPEILLQMLEARRRALPSFQDSPILAGPVRQNPRGRL